MCEALMSAWKEGSPSHKRVLRQKKEKLHTTSAKQLTDNTQQNYFPLLVNCMNFLYPRGIIINDGLLIRPKEN